MSLLWSDGPPRESIIDAFNTSTQNLADEPTMAMMDPHPVNSSIFALNTATPNLVDEPTLADGPPSIRAEMP